MAEDLPGGPGTRRRAKERRRERNRGPISLRLTGELARETRPPANPSFYLAGTCQPPTPSPDSPSNKRRQFLTFSINLPAILSPFLYPRFLIGPFSPSYPPLYLVLARPSSSASESLIIRSNSLGRSSKLCARDMTGIEENSW